MRTFLISYCLQKRAETFYSCERAWTEKAKLRKRVLRKKEKKWRAKFILAIEGRKSEFFSVSKQKKAKRKKRRNKHRQKRERKKVRGAV